MRVPLPGRDYFPPRVLLRGPARTAPVKPRLETRGAPPMLRAGPALMPASPPAPMIGAQPAAA